MTFITVKDLNKSRDLWNRLNVEQELTITRDGQPCAILVHVTPDTAQATSSEIRRVLFSTAVSRVRQKAGRTPPAEADVEKMVQASRRERRMS